LLIAAVLGSACVDGVFREKLFAARKPVAWIANRVSKRAWTLTPEEEKVLGALLQPARKKQLELACARVQAKVRKSTKAIRIDPWCTYPCAL
jgi:hypothetical protein